MVTWGEKARVVLVHARRAAKEAEPVGGSASERVRLVRELLLARVSGGALSAFADRLTELSVDERHYWSGVFYTLLLPAETRREQAAYFTPPYLANAILDLAIEYGFDLKKGTVLDPAAGGAAFLSTLAARMLETSDRPKEICRRLYGTEIDPGLARLSRFLIADRLGLAKVEGINIHTGDALRRRWEANYDLVVANPPYGRTTPEALNGDHWEKVASSGNINKYAVFAELALRSTKPRGLAALVIPSSFRTGPLYKKLRTFFLQRAEVLCIADVGPRDEVFADVAQDTSVVILRKITRSMRTPTRFCAINSSSGVSDVGTYYLSDNSDEPWPTPSLDALPFGGATLADYGVSVRSGYFVWNREKHRLRTTDSKSTYPLIWAKNVRRGHRCRPEGKFGQGADFVVFSEASTAIITQPAAVLQRTTNNKQPRRLVAAVVDPSVYAKWGGFVTENHTIVVEGKRAADVLLISQLLNTATVDMRYRALSGTATVSVQLLRTLDLPRPELFTAALKVHSDTERAAIDAYEVSAQMLARRHVA